MHEHSLARAVVRQVVALAQERGARRVCRVVVRQGALGHGRAEPLREHFVQAARGTLAEGAVLEVVPTDELVDLVVETVEVEVATP